MPQPYGNIQQPNNRPDQGPDWSYLEWGPQHNDPLGRQAYAFGAYPGVPRDPYGNAITAGAEAAYDPWTWMLSTDNVDRAKGFAGGLHQQGDAMGMDALGMLRSAAMGQQPSAAEMQMKSGLEGALRGQLAAASSSRSANPAATFRQANQSGLTSALQNNQAMGALRANEMANARGQYLTGAQNHQNILEQRAKFYIQLGMSQDEAIHLAKREAAQLQSQIAMGQLQANQSQRGQDLQLAGASVNAAGTFAGSLIPK